MCVCCQMAEPNSDAHVNNDFSAQYLPKRCKYFPLTLMPDKKITYEFESHVEDDSLPAGFNKR